MEECLHTQWSKLARTEIDTQEELKQSILCGSTTRVDGTIDWRAGICSRTARKWFNRLGYKWKDEQKGVFFDGHKQEDVVEYCETFLEEMESLLPYFVEFWDDGTILSKEYPEDCAVGGLNWQSIIMIIHDESTFSANDSRWKIWTFEDRGIFDEKEEARVLWSQISYYRGHSSIYSLFLLNNKKT